MRPLADTDLAGPGAAADDPKNQVTVYCGISVSWEGDDLDNMLYHSDQVLYLCKDHGGNCVEISTRAPPCSRSSLNVVVQLVTCRVP